MTALSERCVVAVEFPLARRPSKVDLIALVRRDAPVECRRLIGPAGRIVGLVSASMAERREDGQPCLVVKFACDVPESVQAAGRN
jgi:hypothetical protein